ncbi:Acetyl-CoA synthetase-like protein [Pleurostoma richardsiae]|uniref:Acetyl-CoA synthetase-like protein n=1 Tax=Pleurostoma richardsiae TaxID=41990 RepID=A0AA38S9C7_9PEZI|nr:Acetyl-CoA synthetase-like protein [Pleurostoma richardsiae]
MVFVPPAWVPKLPFDPPDSIPIVEFMSDEKYGRYPLSKSRNPFTCGLTGRTFTSAQVFERTENLAKALGKRMGWVPNDGTTWDKVVGVFSLNTIDYVTVLYAIHRLNGIATPANAVYSAAELGHQLKSSGATALFTCIPLLETAVRAAKASGIPESKVFIMGIPGFEDKPPFVTVENLIVEGVKLPALDRLRWGKGQGARQPAFLCYSSGTSGLPKAVMISHRNVIANAMQYRAHESVGREKLGVETQVMLGLLPFSHIYGLVVGAHGGPYRGDEVIVLPKFELPTFLRAVERFKINHLLLVPPIVIRIIRSPEECKKYDLSSVRYLYVGAAPTGEETVKELKQLYPKWNIGQGYGMTETATVVVSTSEHDILNGSSGSLVPGTRAKVIGLDGREVTGHQQPGELLIQSPSVTLGYLNNEKASSETFVWDEDGRWIRTGDEVIVTKSPAGHEHIVVVDRIKELIKVKGHQVAPAELEAHLLTHPAVSDCAVIQIPDERSGEVPKAFVVLAGAFAGKPQEEVAGEILKFVEEHKAPYKWIKGGIEFVEVIPKSPSGKILRRLLRDKEKAARKAKGAKL